MANCIHKIEIKKGPSRMDATLNYDYYIKPNYDMRFTTKNQTYIIDNDAWARFIRANKSCYFIADLIEDIFYNSILVTRIPSRSKFPFRSRFGLFSSLSFICGIVGIDTGEPGVPD